MKKGLLAVIVILVLALAVGAYLYVNNMKNGSVSSNGQQYQTPAVSGVSDNTSAGQAASKYSGLDLTPAAGQTDSLPSSSSNIAAP